MRLFLAIAYDWWVSTCKDLLYISGVLIGWLAAWWGALHRFCSRSSRIEVKTERSKYSRSQCMPIRNIRLGSKTSERP